MNLGVRAQENSLYQIFGNGARLCMPPYQRSYSWGENEALDLLGDLLDSSKSGLPHFVGAVVLIDNPEKGEIEIVDGQQRLTTLTILLAVLRDLEQDKDRAAAIHALIADPPRPMLGESASWRLTLNHMDGPFFRHMIQEPGATLHLEREPGDSDSQRRMTRNASAFHKELSKMDEAQRHTLTDVVTKGCGLVIVNVEDKDQGFKVFRVLNTRGKEPDAHDIIKTELFQKARFDVQDAAKYSEQWAEHEAQLGGSAFDDLLRQIRAIYDRSPKGDLIAGFQKTILKQMDTRHFLDSVLPRHVEAYQQVTTANVPDGPNQQFISEKLNQLRVLEQRSWRAPAIKFIVDRGLDDPHAPEFFKQLERLSYVIQLIVHDRDQRNKRFNKVSEAIRNDKALFSKNGPFTISRDERRKVAERLVGRFATFGQRRALALRLNAAIEGGKTIPPQSDATVEHVLPRNVQDDSHWTLTWPDPHKRREQCDTLGNFVLLTNKVNQKADRLDYRSKKEIYFDGGGGSEFALTRDLREQNAWTSDVVRKRTDQLANILMQEWDLI